MVSIIKKLSFLFLGLFFCTYTYYQKNNSHTHCSLRILTSSSFYNSLAKELTEKFKSTCELKFEVVSGANLIVNLFIKQPDRYDVLIGLDQYQIQRLQNLKLNLSYEVKDDNINKKFIAYDEAPITFFVKNIKQTDFETLNDFILYAEDQKLKLAIPLRTTSVIGQLYFDWYEQEFNTSNLKIKNPTNIKKVKSWSESIGLFERGLVDGFLSFETSEIYFKDKKDIKKISLKTGHPNLKEYFMFSSRSLVDRKLFTEFHNLMKSEDVQKLILKRNYMWPTSTTSHEFNEFRSLKVKDLKPARESQIETLKIKSHFEVIE